MEALRGNVFDIQRYSLHDGPGLRTNVFLKGCNLRCQWCSNPESLNYHPEIAFFERNCFLCGDCIPVCKPGAIQMRDGKIHWDRSKCTQCFECASVCTAHAFSVIGREITVEEVLAEVRRDVPFYGNQGGLTLTGGEPSLQVDFSAALLRQAQAEGIHTAIETCGYAPWKNYELLLPHLDMVMFDLKHIDPEIHQRYTGRTNVTILENLKRIDSLYEMELIVRIPLIPDFNADHASLSAMIEFLKTLKRVKEIHLLGYHTLGRGKYQALEIPYPYDDFPPMPPEEIEKWAALFQESNFMPLIGG